MIQEPSPRDLNLCTLRQMLGGKYRDEILQFALLYLSPTNDLEALAKAIPKARRNLFDKLRRRHLLDPFARQGALDIKPDLRKILAPATVDAPDKLTAGYRSES